MQNLDARLVEMQKELNSDRSWRINTIQYDGDPHAPIQHPDGDARQFAQMGVTNTLDQVFRAPEVIKRVMCDHAAVNKTFVGTGETQRQIDADAAERREHRWVKSPISTLWTPSHRYSKVTSKYSKGAAYRVEDTRPGRILRAGGDKGDDEAVAIKSKAQSFQPDVPLTQTHNGPGGCRRECRRRGDRCRDPGRRPPGRRTPSVQEE